MLRHRDIAASPVRSASTTWQVISDLVVSTFAKSPDINDSDVRACMDAAAGVGRQLVAGGHLKQHAVTVIGGLVHCEIRTISGIDAFRLEEDLSAVSGASNASDFTVYLPTPAPLEAAVIDAAEGVPHLKAETPPTSAAKSAESSLGHAIPRIDAAALRRLRDSQ